ncbi:MAG: 2-phosphosulfolactate phosphatase [Xylanivirga thermophila]|jgi:2-phosphosulfolactate phosphatase|uniref:2-phosphosulfolactate phosphatase n=1 Tax=Xylanivirga thermophila TaxID=2496273 RepID=UPI00101E1516|nr:2-phosphosulfolactate phosphatase [Xylanivirga thermophila]
MTVDVYPTRDSVIEKEIKDKVVVVVDVLRATSTIITALYNGCKEVIPVMDIEEAMVMTKNYERDAFLLGGERNAVKIEGFDLSNSPLEYTRDKVEGNTIIFTTTNGTKAIKQAGDAKKVLIGSIINADALCGALLDLDADVAFVCAGTEGRFSLDDIIAVGAIISRLKSKGAQLSLDDLAMVCLYLYESNKSSLHDILKDTYHYKRLLEEGFTDDLKYCLTPNRAPIVPMYKDGVIKNIY